MAGKLNASLAESIRKPGRYSDGRGEGLQLFVQERSGRVRKSWVQRLTINGRRVDRGLGGYPAYGIAEARELAKANAAKAKRGRDPFEEREAEAVPSFAKAAEEYIRLNAPNWKTSQTKGAWRGTLRDYVLPRIGRMPVDKITTADVLAILTPIWHAKPTTAKRTKRRVSNIMLWCVAQGYRTDDPAGPAIDAALPSNGKATEHLAAVPHEEVREVIDSLKDLEGAHSAAFAVEFAIHTAARSGEVRGARWEEIDLDRKVWTVPAERYKTGKDHRVRLPCMRSTS